MQFQRVASKASPNISEQSWSLLCFTSPSEEPTRSLERSLTTRRTIFPSEVKISTYKKSMERLKWVKAEIEKYRSAAEENKERLQRDFEAWYLSLQAHQASVAGAEAVRPASAQSPAAVVESSPRSNSAQESRKAPGAHEGVLAASGVPQEPPATSLTGHQQTDDDIRAYFAAVANLESR
ncbi:Hypothetical protein (Fragment) [Durusdinium trenchii]|uniref:Kinesin-like protein KIF6/9 C-terminal domain-containing protein n=1 Tax=Durusdinium trenchii TaxID=1381693 RepID=A0ABP0P048_9DINO